MVSAAKKMLAQIYKPGYRYQKCGVQLAQITPLERAGQLDLFEAESLRDNDKKRMYLRVLINQYLTFAFAQRCGYCNWLGALGHYC